MDVAITVPALYFWLVMRATYVATGAVGIRPLAATAILGLIEALVVHLVLSRWSITAAWILTGLSVYGSLWLMALGLRPPGLFLLQKIIPSRSWLCTEPRR